MKKIFLGICALSTITFCACNDESTTQNTANTENVTPNNNTEITSLEPSSNLIQETTTEQSVQTNGKPGENPYANLKGNNPEHGQPGHRCDINVGEPLNLPPRTMEGGAQATQPLQMSQPVQQPSVPVQMNTPQATPAAKTEPGFSGKPNPAHGQPGHRCDINEGEILP